MTGPRFVEEIQDFMAPKTQAYLAELPLCEIKRAEVLNKLSGEARTSGVPTLMVEADGGMIRTGQLVDLDPEDPGYGEETKRGKPRRKRPTQYRELITMDVRKPGQLEPTTLDVLAPVGAPQGERSRRLLALAGRGGLGDNTRVKGLGDLGSGLPAAFDEAFVGYQADFSADWKHICEGDWENFKHSELAHEQSHFAQAPKTRLQQAVDEGHLGPGVISDTDSPRPASAQADNDQSQACAGG